MTVADVRDVAVAVGAGTHPDAGPYSFRYGTQTLLGAYNDETATERSDDDNRHVRYDDPWLLRGIAAAPPSIPLSSFKGPP